jgi:hypothetical protein
MMKNFDEFVELRRMWVAAFTALKEAESVIFFGYSFPPSDAAIAQMLRNTLGESKKLQRIAVIDTNLAGPVARLRKCFPEKHHVDGRQIALTHFEVPVDRSCPKWYRSSDEPVEMAANGHS